MVNVPDSPALCPFNRTTQCRRVFELLFPEHSGTGTASPPSRPLQRAQGWDHRCSETLQKRGYLVKQVPPALCPGLAWPACSGCVQGSTCHLQWTLSPCRFQMKVNDRGVAGGFYFCVPQALISPLPPPHCRVGMDGSGETAKVSRRRCDQCDDTTEYVTGHYFMHKSLDM